MADKPIDKLTQLLDRLSEACGDREPGEDEEFSEADIQAILDEVFAESGVLAK